MLSVPADKAGMAASIEEVSFELGGAAVLRGALKLVATQCLVPLRRRLAKSSRQEHATQQGRGNDGAEAVRQGQASARQYIEMHHREYQDRQ